MYWLINQNIYHIETVVSNITSASAMPPTTAPILSPGVESMTLATVTMASSQEHGRSSPVLSFT